MLILISMGILIMELDLIEFQNILILGVDMSFSAHIDNKKNNILVLGKGPTQGLEHTLTAEKMYSINFTVAEKNFI